MKALSPTSPMEISPMVGKIPGIPATPPMGGSYSNANRRVSPNGTERVYPVLLVVSTLVAAAFCYLYITKPVRIISQPLALQPHPSTATPPASMPVAEAKTKSDTPIKQRRGSILPGEATLPGEVAAPAAPVSPASAKAQPPTVSPFEETNLRIQHILNAEASNGEISKIVLNVPVLYQSRNLRWTLQDVAQARELLNRLADYQEKSVALRAEGAALLGSWNHLVEKSIPSRDVRADSPSLPTNQKDAADSPQPGELSTPQAIQVQPVEK